MQKNVDLLMPATYEAVVDKKPVAKVAKPAAKADEAKVVEAEPVANKKVIAPVKAPAKAEDDKGTTAKS